MIASLETSAAAKLLFVEAESAGMAAYLAHVASEGHSVVSSALLETELRRGLRTVSP